MPFGQLKAAELEQLYDPNSSTPSEIVYCQFFWFTFLVYITSGNCHINAIVFKD